MNVYDFRDATLKFLDEMSGGFLIIDHLVEHFKETLDVEASAIRICQGSDYPYFAGTGFPDEYLEEERSLLPPDCSDRGIGADDEPRLECICGAVIQGHADSSKPYFTGRGSFWTNNFSELAETVAGESWHTKMRSFCRENGYESIALVPIQVNNDTIGLLQLNDKRKSFFTKELVEMLETVCDHIGVALLRGMNEERKQEAVWSRSIMDMAGSTCHDINQPLQVILGDAELIINNIIERNSPMMDSCLEEIHQQALRIRDLTAKLQNIVGYKSKRSQTSKEKAVGNGV